MSEPSKQFVINIEIGEPRSYTNRKGRERWQCLVSHALGEQLALVYADTEEEARRRAWAVAQVFSE